jgi:hypothetical protein
VVIYLGIPMYGGAHGLTVSSLLASQKLLLEEGHEVITDIVSGGSILTKVRNGIVKRFLDSSADVLMFLDSDMVWEAKTLQKLVESPFDISVANYRKRNNEVTYLAKAHGTVSGLIGANHNGDTWLQTFQAGTGMTAIKRRVFDAMPLQPTYEDGGESISCFFDFELREGQYYGEDYTFCRKAVESGAQIFILANAYVGHIGETVYGGNYAEHLAGGNL